MTNLAEVYQRWPDQAACIRHLETVRWGASPICTYCGTDRVGPHKEADKERWQCAACRKSFSVTVGTIFHKTRVDLQLWFLLIALMAKKKGLSSMQAARDLDMRQATIWAMMRRVRQAAAADAGLLASIIEVMADIDRRHPPRGLT